MILQDFVSTMDLINTKSEGSVLIICEDDFKSQSEQDLKNISKKTIKSASEIPGLTGDTFDTILVQLPEQYITNSLLGQLLKLNKPGSTLILSKIKDTDNTEFLLKTSGFGNVEIKQSGNNSNIVASRPMYEIGSSKKLNLKKPAPVWKLDDDEDEEIIDPDNLLDDEDLKKPDPSSLRVCGTTGKRKACKDCSCGLADELAQEVQNRKVIDVTDGPKSSCGSCYLGDAFRCASCPYLGMPAFKPGEKIQLTDTLLKSDI